MDEDEEAKWEQQRAHAIKTLDIIITRGRPAETDVKEFAIVTTNIREMMEGGQGVSSEECRMMVAKVLAVAICRLRQYHAVQN